MTIYTKDRLNVSAMQDEKGIERRNKKGKN